MGSCVDINSGSNEHVCAYGEIEWYVHERKEWRINSWSRVRPPENLMDTNELQLRCVMDKHQGSEQARQPPFFKKTYKQCQPLNLV